MLCRVLREKFPCIAHVAAGQPKEWSSVQIIFHVPQTTGVVGCFPDDKRIVLHQGQDCEIMSIWDIERGVQICSPLQGHTNYVTSVAFSSDGIRIVSGSWDKTVRIWDIERGVQIGSPLQDHTDYV